MRQDYIDPLDVECGQCRVQPGNECIGAGEGYHLSRFDRLRDVQDGVALPTYAPTAPEFTATKDGEGEPTLWLDVDGRLEPVVRRCDLSPSHRDVWPLIVAGVVGS